MEKYRSYTTEDSLYQKIELHKNFRSRASVLESVNYLFYRIMQESLGGIAYTEEAALHPGLSYAEGEGITGGSTELLLLDLAKQEAENQESAGEEAEEERTGRGWEAKLVGERILKLVDPDNPQMVWDKENQCYRPAAYGDIVILLRSLSGFAEEFVNTLMEMGIPAYAESRSGYFNTIEVQTVLNLLHIIDNPIQDIPLAAVLHSPMGGFTSEELSLIRGFCPKEMGNGFYGAMLFYREHGREEDSLHRKVKTFLDDLSGYREMAEYLPLHSLLEQILEQTGYYDYVSLMPGGERRRANVDMLLQKALAYESTSYKGVFHFIRYIELLQKYAVDFGEASIAGENEDTVRIMSIHKSKGLEFPIVILAGCGKKFNVQDTRAKVVFHPDYGMGLDAINPKLRTKAPTLLKRAFAQKLLLENLGEELRVLYVALTRAKEKLILTGACKDLNACLEKVSLYVRNRKKEIGYGILSKAGSYLDFILPVFADSGLYDQDDKSMIHQVDIEGKDGRKLFVVSCMDCGTLAERQKEAVCLEELQMQEFLQWDDTKVWEPEWAEEIARRFAYSYHYDRLYEVYAAMSVSELKKLSQVQAQEENQTIASLYPQEQAETKPAFLREKDAGKVTPARRGTLYHLVMEYIPYKKEVTEETIRDTLEEMEKKGILTREERGLIVPERLMPFFHTSLYKKIYEAAENGSLHREQQFLIGISVEELSGEREPDFAMSRETALPLTDPNRSGGDFVMVQGVIDLYFEEEDGLILIDYKTDRVRKADTLRKRYQVQIDYYQKALEKLTGKQVKERYLYSFALNDMISV